MKTGSGVIHVGVKSLLRSLDFGTSGVPSLGMTKRDSRLSKDDRCFSFRILDTQPPSEEVCQNDGIEYTRSFFGSTLPTRENKSKMHTIFLIFNTQYWKLDSICFQTWSFWSFFSSWQYTHTRNLKCKSQSSKFKTRRIVRKKRGGKAFLSLHFFCTETWQKPYFSYA